MIQLSRDEEVPASASGRREEALLGEEGAVDLAANRLDGQLEFAAVVEARVPVGATQFEDVLEDEELCNVGIDESARLEWRVGRDGGVHGAPAGDIALLSFTSWCSGCKTSHKCGGRHDHLDEVHDEAS